MAHQDASGCAEIGRRVGEPEYEWSQRALWAVGDCATAVKLKLEGANLADDLARAGAVRCVPVLARRWACV